MRAHQIMTREVTTVRADTPIREAAGLMLQLRISGLPVVDENNRLVGQAAIVAAENVPGVRLVHDHLYSFDASSGLSFRSPEDEEWARTR